MLTCDRCGRTMGQEMLRCPHMGTDSSCPYRYREEKISTVTARGLTRACVGALIMYVTFSVPKLLLSEDTGIITISLQILLISAVMLLGLFIFLWGLTLLFGKKVLLYSNSEGKCLERHIFNGYAFYSRALTLRKFAVPDSLLELKLNLPAEAAALEMPRRVFTELDNLKEEQEANNKDLSELLKSSAVSAVEGAFYQLLIDGFIKIRKGLCEETRGKRINSSKSRTVHQICLGSRSADEQPGGRLAAKLYRTTRKIWDKSEDYQNILAPTLGEIIKEAFASKKEVPVISILQLAEDEAVVSGLYSRKEGEAPEEKIAGEIEKDRETLKEIRHRLDDLSKPGEICNEIERAVLQRGEGSQISSLFSLERISGKEVRIVLVLIALFSVFALKYVYTLSRVSELAESITQNQPQRKELRKQAIIILNRYEEHMRSKDLSEITGDGLKLLRRLLRDADPYIRSKYLNFLAELNLPEAKRFLLKKKEVLISLLKAKEREIRASAANALGSLGQDAEDAINDLIYTLADSEPFVRFNAVAALDRIGVQGNRIVPPLTLLLNDSDRLVKEAAIIALGNFGEYAGSAVDDLTEILRGDDQQQRKLVLQALHQIGTPEAKLVLETFGDLK